MTASTGGIASFFSIFMNRFIALVLSSLTTISLAADRPNILFIFSDDHAQHAISAYGSKVNTTPHLDRIAEGGARHLGSDPQGFDRWIVLPGQGAYWNPEFLIEGRKLKIEGHCTDITGDLGVEFLKTRPGDKPFFLMLHQKAPHRAWEPDERNKALFADKVIPEPDTLFDDYATRPAALPENEQTVAKDLTRRDLKLTPPKGLEGPALRQWLGR